MLVDIPLQPQEACSVSQKDGGTVITLPLEVVKRAYCDYVAREVTRARKPEGVLQ